MIEEVLISKKEALKALKRFEKEITESSTYPHKQIVLKAILRKIDDYINGEDSA